MKNLTIDEVKKVLEYYDDENLKGVSEILEDSSFDVNLDDLTYDEQEEFEKKFNSVVASKISEEDYESLMDDEEIDSYYLENIIIASNNSDLIKKSIQILKNKWNETEIKNLILATKDKDFMYETLINSSEYNIGYWNMTEILLSADGKKYDWKKYKDVTFIDLLIEKGDINLISNIIHGNSSLDNYHKKELIVATHNSKFIKECIDDDSLEWNKYDIRELIEGIDNPEYIIEILENHEIDDEVFEVKLISKTKDESYIKQKIKEEKFRLDRDKILIGSFNIELIKDCISNREIYSLSEYNIENILLEIGRKEYIEKALQDTPELVEDMLKSTKEYIINAIKDNEDVRQIAGEKIIENLNDEEITERVIEDEELSWNTNEVYRLLISTGESNLIKKIIQSGKYEFNYSQTTSLIVAIGMQDENSIKDILKTGKIGVNKLSILQRLGNEKLIEEFMEDEEFEWDTNAYDLKNFLITTHNPKYIKKFLKSDKYEWSLGAKAELSFATEDKDIIFNFIIDNHYSGDSRVIPIIDGISDEEKLVLFKAIHDAGLKEYIFEYVKTKGIEYFNDNIEYIMKLEGVEEQDVPYKKDCILKMYENNNEILGTIDYKILDPKYIDRLGLDKINQISCYQGVQKQVLELSESQLRVFSQCIENCDNARWTPLAQMFLQNSSQFNELIDNIAKTEEGKIDFKKINIIIQDENIFQIKNLEEVENFEQIRKEKCDEWIRSDDIEKKKLAVLEKIYGQSLEYSKTLITKFGNDIDLIQDGELKDYIKSINAIIELEDVKVIEEIYEKCQEVENIDKINIEEELKSEYAKLFNEDLFTLDQAKQIEEGIYDAGTDFKIILTALSPFVDNTRKINNYKDDWNRPEIASQHFCASYVRNDMIGTAPVYNICYRIFSYVE